MRAWRVTGPGEPSAVLTTHDIEVAALPPGHVRCAVRAAGVGWPDLAMCRGTYAFRPPPPATLGQEFCGEIIEVASDVDDPLAVVGGRVAGVSSFFTGDGAFAESTIARPSTLYPVPPAMSDVDAAAFCIPFHTAHAAFVVRAQVQPGETVLVHGGAGGTGSAAIQLAVALGARVFATAGGAAKAAICAQLGAEIAIDHHRESFPERIDELTDGRGVDVVFDPVGGDVYEQSFACLATHGRMLPVGLASGRWGTTPIGRMALRNISVMTASPTGYDRSTALDYHASLLALHAEGAIAPLVGATVEFNHLPQALEAIAERTSVGRTVVTMPATTATRGLLP